MSDNLISGLTRGLWRFAAATTLLVGAAVAWATPEPVATAGAAEGFLGTQVTVPVSFDNTGDAVGYGPYVEIVLPPEPPEPLAWVGADYLAPLSPLGPFTPGQNHPFLVDSTGAPVQFTGAQDSQIYVVELPFGSITSSQPPIDFEVLLDISDQAAPEQPLDVQVSSGFRYGIDPLNNPRTDAPITQGTPNIAQVTPKLLELSKNLIAPEGDTAIGSNFVYSFELVLEIAPGQSLTSAQLTDHLPSSLVYKDGSLTVAFDGVSNPGAYTAHFEGDCNGPTTGADAGPCNNTDLTIDLGTVTSDGPDVGTVTATFDFYLDVVDADGNQTGTNPSVQGINTADVTGQWGGNNGAPIPQTVTDSDEVDLEITNVSVNHPVNENGTLRLQKWVGSSGSEQVEALPGDLVDFYLEFQISDAAAFRNVLVVDHLPDGLEFVAGSVSFEYNRRGVSFGGGIVPESVLEGTDGGQIMTFNVSNLLAGHTDNGDLLGACVEPGVGALSCGNYTGTTGRIVYQAEVLDTYLAPSQHNHPYVVQHDLLENTATMSGDILDVVNLELNGSSDSESGTASVRIPGADASKQVAFINGEAVPVGSNASVGPGDEVTFRLLVNLGALSFRDLLISDYLPLPVFEAERPDIAGTCASASSVPASGEACFVGGADRWVPAYTVETGASSGSNSVTFDLDSHTQTGAVTRATIELLYTVPVADTVLTDGLFISNLLEVRDRNGANVEAVSNQLAQLRYTRPQLNISNGVIAIGGQSSVTFPTVAIAPSLISGGADGQRDDPVYDQDVDGLDAGDVVTYLVIVENTGFGVHGAHEISLQEQLPAGIAIGDITNLQFFYGDGTAISGLPADAIAQLFGSGLDLPASVELAPGRNVDDNDAPNTLGDNILYYTYDVVLEDAVESYTRLETTSIVTGYSGHSEDIGTRDARNLVEPNEPIEDLVHVSIRELGLNKSIVWSSEAHTVDYVDDPSDLAIGELVRYRLKVDIPEGTTTNLVVSDELPEGLQIAPAPNDNSRIVFVSAGTMTSTLLTVGVVPTIPGSIADTGATITPSVSDREVSFNLGTITNSASDAATESIIIEFNAFVTDIPSNSRGTNLVNSFSTTSGADSRSKESNEVTATVREPNLSISKSTTATGVVQAGDQFDYMITVSNGNSVGDVAAFDVTVTDELSDLAPWLNLTLPHTLDDAGIDATVSITRDNPETGDLTATVSRIDPGEGFTITIPVTVRNTVRVGMLLDNSVDLTASSLPGDHGTLGTSPEEREYELEAGVQVQVDEIAPTKTVVATSEPSTGVDGNNRNAVTVGEVVRYRLAATLPAGTSPNLTFSDTLPDGIGLFATRAEANVTAVIIGSADNQGPGDVERIDQAGGMCIDTWPASSEIAYPMPEARITEFSGQNISFSFGDIVAERTADATCVIVEFDVLVLNTADVSSGAILTNDFVASTGSIATGDLREVDSTDVDVVVVEPDLVVTKTTNAEAEGSQAGDTITYTITVAHTANSQADAFDVHIIDPVLPDELENVGWVLDHSNGTQLATGSVPVGTHSISVPPIDEILQGDSVTLTIAGTLSQDVEPNQTITNEVDVTWTSLPGTHGTGSVTPGNPGEDDGERQYSSNDEHDFTTETISVVKSIVATSEDSTDGTDLTIGEVVRYRIDVYLPMGTTSDLTVTDVLPVGLSTDLSFANTSYAANLNSSFIPVSLFSVQGQTVTWTLDRVVNQADDDEASLSFEFNAYVNGTGTARGDILSNSATVTWADDNSSASNVVDATVVEPELQIVKSASPTTGLDAHDIVTYSIQVDHSDASDADAHDVMVLEDLPDFVTLVDSTLAIGSGLTTPVSGSPTPEGLYAYAIGTLEQNQTAVLTIRVRLNENAPANHTLTNSASLTWASLPDGGQTPNQTGSLTPDGQVREYDEGPVTADVTTQALAIAKSVAGTSEGHTTGNTVTIGEVVRYRLAVDLPEGDSFGVTVVDTLPANVTLMTDPRFSLAAVSADPAGVVTVGGTGTIAGGVTVGDAVSHVTAAPALLDTTFTGFNDLPGADYDLTGQQLTIDLGVVSNRVAGNDDAQLLIEFDAVVLDGASNELINSATVTSGEADERVTSTPATASVNAVQPEVTIVKTIVDAPGYADLDTAALPADEARNLDYSDEVTFKVVVQNENGQSGADARQVVVSDPLPAGMTLVSYSVTPTNVFTEGSNHGSTQLELVLQELGPGEILEVEYTVELAAYGTADAPQPGDDIVNTASVTGTTLGKPGDSDYDNPLGVQSDQGLEIEEEDTATTAVTDTSPDFEVVKTMLGLPTADGDRPGVFTVDFYLDVINRSDIPLTDISMMEDVTDTFVPNEWFDLTNTVVTVDSIEVRDPATGNAVGPQPTIAANVNPAFNGITVTEILRPDEAPITLEQDQNLRVFIRVDVTVTDPDALFVPNETDPTTGEPVLENIITAYGKTPGGIPPEDDERVPSDPEEFQLEDPSEITLTKSVSNADANGLLPDSANNGDGSYNIDFRFVVENTGDWPVTIDSLVDDLTDTYGAGVRFETVSVTFGSDPGVPDGIDANNDFGHIPGGASDFNVITVTGDPVLDPGETFTVGIRGLIWPPNTVIPYTNTATVSAIGTVGQEITDDDGVTHSFAVGPDLAVGTCATYPAIPADTLAGTYLVNLQVTVSNGGNVQLDDMSAQLDLATIFGSSAMLGDITATADTGAALNTNYGASGDWQLFASDYTLYSTPQTGEPKAVTFNVTAEVTPVSGMDWTYQLTAQGQSPVWDDGDVNNGLVTALSYTNCDPNDPTTPNDTPIGLTGDPAIEVTKDMTLLTLDDATGEFLVTFEFGLTNTGDVPLTDVELLDNLNVPFSTHGATWSIESITADAPLVADSPANAEASGNLLTSASELGTAAQAASPAPDTLADTAGVTLVVRVAPTDLTVEYTNTAEAGGTPIKGDPVEDDDDASFMFEQPAIGLAKSAPATFDLNGATVSNPHSVGDGSYLINYVFTIENFGDVALTDLVLTDDLAGQLADGNPTAYSVTGGTLLTGNADYDGAAASNILAAGQSLDVGEADTVSVTVTVVPGAALANGTTLTLLNRAEVEGTSPAGQTPTDESVDGLEPDADGDGDPTNDESDTTVSIQEVPGIALAKDETGIVNNHDGTYDVTWLFTVQNIGLVNLGAVQLSDNFTDAFNGAPVAILSITPEAGSSLAAATDLAAALTSGDLLDEANSTLAAGATATVTVVTRVTPGDLIYTQGNPTVFENVALVSGTSPSGTDVEDESTDGVNPDPEGDGPGDNDDPTPVTLTEDPGIALGKELTDVEVLGDGTFRVSLHFTIENVGDVDLSGISLVDPLGTTFNGAPYTYVSITASGDLVANQPAGVVGDELLDGSSFLAYQDSATVDVVVDVVPGTRIYDQAGDPVTFNNTATVTGTSPGDVPVDDDSNDGDTPDPADDTPTPIELIESPEIALAKALTDSRNLEDGTYELDFVFNIENTGDVNLHGVQLSDDFATAFRGSPFTITALSATAPLSAASIANAQATGDLLDASLSTLAVGEAGTVTLTMQVVPGARIYDGEFENLADVTGTSPSERPVTDRSNDGTDPEPGTETPTPILLEEDPIIAVAKNYDRYENVTTGVYRVFFTFTLSNVGDVDLHGVQLTDDLSAAFRGSPYVLQSLTAEAPLTANSIADATLTGDLLDASASTLDVGETATVSLALDITPGARIYDGPFLNTADARGTSPGEFEPEDPSNNGLTPVPGEDTPTPVSLIEVPVIGVAKSADVTPLGDGRYDVLFTFTIRNYGTAEGDAVEVRNVQLTDNLDDAFGAGNYRVQSVYSPTLTTNTAAPDPANPAAFDGSSNLNLLAGTDTIAVGEIGIVELRVIVTPPEARTYLNVAHVTGRSPGNVPVEDDSTTGDDPDPNGDGTPDEDVPTEVPFDENPAIGLAKAATVTSNDDGSFNIELEFTLVNMGDVPLSNVTLQDPLSGIYAITDLTPDRISVQSSVLTENPGYDGNSDPEILAGTDSMPVGAERTVRVILRNVRPTSGTSTTNSALAGGESPTGTPVEDRSTDGFNPDPNDDGTPDEDEPTPIELERITQIALAKSGSLTIEDDGQLELVFTLNVANTGNVALYGVQVSDDLADYYANTDLTADMIEVASSDFTVNPAFDGATDSQLLSGLDTLAIGGTGSITVTLTGFTPDAGVTELANSALATGRGPDGTPTDDPSNDGEVPEPGKDVPTVTKVTEDPLLGIAKDAAVVMAADGTYTVSFTFVIGNYGNTTLRNISVTDDLSAFQAIGLTGVSLTSDHAGLPVNSGFNGVGDMELLAPGAQLAVGESGSVTMELRGLTGPASLTNVALGDGESPRGTPTPPERSTNGEDPDPNGDGTPDEDEPTPVELAADPILGVAKRAGVVQNTDGSYRVSFDIVVRNMGNTPIVNLQVNDDLTEFYAGTDLTAAAISVSSATLTVNPGFDGDADTALLAGVDSLAVGAEASLTIVLDPVTPGNATRFTNTAIGTGETPGGDPVRDDSTDGDDPDPNGDGTPDEDEPTPVVLEPTPLIGVAKRADVTANADGSFDIVFDFVVENLGNTELQAVQVRDDLSVFYGPTDISAGNLTVSSADFTPNASYDGLTDLNLLAGTDTLAVGESGTLSLAISGLRISEPVDTFNTAIGTARDPNGTPTPPDPSNDGDDPDPDGDGDPTNNNDPTPVRLGDKPVIGVAKSADTVDNADGSYDITFSFTVVNYSQVPLADLSLADPLAEFYAKTNLTAARVSVSSSDLTVNPGFDGDADTELLAPGQSLAGGETALVSIFLNDVVPNSGITRVDNSAVAGGTAPDGNRTRDTSTDGGDPDPDGDGDPGNDSTPTTVHFGGARMMMIDKDADQGPYMIGDIVNYTVTITNPNDVATAITLTDTIPPATAYVDGTTVIGAASAVPAEGSEPRQDEPGVLTWRGMVLPVGGSVTVSYDLRILPGAESPLVNVARIEGTDIRAEATESVLVDQGVFDLSSGTLIGRVYLDVDRDDTYDEGVDVPLQNARVVLSNGWQALTDEQGNYAFRELEAGTWTVMVDQLTTPYQPADHVEQLRDPRQHRVEIHGVTVSDFPFVDLAGLASTRRETFVNFGPIELHKYQVPLGDTVRVVLDITSAEAWPPLLITDPVPGNEAREFVIELNGTDPVVLTYDLPAGVELTDPEIEWSN